MPASFLSRHRTICDTIKEIQDTAKRGEDCGLFPGEAKTIMKLCDEAITYAQSMSAKLQEYKDRERDASTTRKE